MSHSLPSHEVEALLAQSGWVRALARRLAAEGADDVEQATWVAALDAPHRSGAPLREWLGAVVRNFARQTQRTSGRRHARERRAAVPEALPSTAEMVERAELAQRIARAVTALDEPYRTAVFLRYFEDLPPRRIAERLGVPVATVRTRLARAIEKLRASFDAEHGGDRSAWLGGLVPLLGPTMDVSAPALGTVIAMNTKLVALALSAAVIGVSGWWYLRPEEPVKADAPAAAAPATETRAIDAPSGAAPSMPSERDVAPAPARPEPAATAASASPEPAAAARAVHGRVIDADGAPVALVQLVVLTGGEPRDGEPDAAESTEASALRSDGAGRFTIPGAPPSGFVASGDPRYATVLRAAFREEPAARETTVVVAPRLALAGTVRDPEGAPVAGAIVSVDLPEGFRSRFDEVLDRSMAPGWRVPVDADGRWALDEVPAIAGAHVRAAREGYETALAPLPAASDFALDLVLARPAADAGFVRGTVVDPSGLPVEGARVAFGIDTTITPENGSFAFARNDPESFGVREGIPPTSLTALKAGFLPARYEPPAGGAGGWPEHVTLRLAGSPATIAGRVVDQAGEPMRGVRVYANDVTAFGVVDGDIAMVETLLAGGKSFWHSVQSDADGRFELTGLLEREYVVRAHDPTTLLRTDVAEVSAGRRDVEIVMPTDEVHARVAGRVLSMGGQPVAGALVFPMCDAFRARLGGGAATAHDAREGVRTDDDGRFEIEAVPKSLVYLRIEGERILPLEYGRRMAGEGESARDASGLPLEDVDALEIRVVLRCHVQVELADASAADAVALYDESGRELVVSLFTAQGRRELTRHLIHDGRSDVLSAPETARTLVLYRNEVEIGRRPITLDPATTTLVRW